MKQVWSVTMDTDAGRVHLVIGIAGHVPAPIDNIHFISRFGKRAGIACTRKARADHKNPIVRHRFFQPSSTRETVAARRRSRNPADTTNDASQERQIDGIPATKAAQ